MNYEEIKRLAKQMKVPIYQLVALDPENDPFYCGMPSQIKQAEWFAELWERFGYTTGVHIRRMHYQIISQDPPVTMVSGRPYENTAECWDELSSASKYARYLDLVKPEAFVDRKNSNPVDTIDYTTLRRGWLWVAEGQQNDLDVALPTFPDLPDYHVWVESPQRYHLEIWCEKSTQDDVLRPLAQKYGACLQYGAGELSMTIAIDALSRAKRSGKPARIFYISDFDPDGWEMPKSMGVKLQYYNQKRGFNLDIKLFPTVLTDEQCKQYNLPRTPIKEKNASKTAFEERFGVGATELDALEALHPGELERILVQELERYYDTDLAQKVRDREQELRQIAREISQRVYAQYEDMIKSLRDEWQAIQDEFAERITTHMEKREAAWQSFSAGLAAEQPEVTEYDAPEATEAEERGGALFDSSRSYMEQNEIYQARKIQSPARKRERARVERKARSMQRVPQTHRSSTP